MLDGCVVRNDGLELELLLIGIVYVWMLNWLMGVWVRMRTRFAWFGRVVYRNFGGPSGGGRTRRETLERSLLFVSEIPVVLLLCVSVVVRIGRCWVSSSIGLYMGCVVREIGLLVLSGGVGVVSVTDWGAWCGMESVIVALA